MKKLINVLLLTILLTSAIILAGCSRQERTNTVFKLVKTVPISDSDKIVQIVEDSDTGVQYIVDGDNWTVRSGGGIKPFSGR